MSNPSKQSASSKSLSSKSLGLMSRRKTSENVDKTQTATTSKTSGGMASGSGKKNISTTTPPPSSSIDEMITSAKPSQNPADKLPSAEDIIADITARPDSELQAQLQTLAQTFQVPTPVTNVAESNANAIITTPRRPPSPMNVSESTTIVPQSQRVMYIIPPAINQIPQRPDSVPYIQQAIDRLQAYIQSLQVAFNNPSNAAHTLSSFLRLDTNEECKIDYSDLIREIMKYNVNTQNLTRVMDMLYNYYVSYSYIVETLTHVTVNVKYTEHQTNVMELIIHFINLCANYVISTLLQLLQNQPLQTRTHTRDVYELLDERQRRLTNLYNSRIIDLQNVTFYKYTENNDDNVHRSVRPQRAEFAIVYVPLRVQRVETRLRY
ncbi:unknown [Helicoverpa armigera nucleopolyhedrovirus]|uniref:Uncharacterized protein n=3 Tax=Helicoverpa armigera nucleopolyhedrovirus TaxID=51313 RepID=Q77K84_9ABAC|nr:hypothetical protein HanGV4gp044 [Helicoverpa armigera nucleopolyhedrovirus G4]NP_203600.1 hypothetical protein [Helicoverpa armigera nucleopolyhedrovirus]BAG74609.1 hypothetical protein [Helicoverpa armigera NPV NNg1]AAG53787.1 unknown [Helicoverpa armigera nucleopolyhedrovirus G4]AAK96296.1 unknown [Helicoverpa armigera nucleopolyhedrovirus]QBM79016.1 hypothetical protein [Helicoverpa armigera nucleopolyhedrovirus]UCC42514.1 hypothetical protein [Helicoverpa armigera nucleopolyhedrovirus